MPLSPLPNTGVILPTPDGDTGIWDDELNAALRNYEAHDHTAGKGLQVPTAGIKINADLSFVLAGVYYAIKDLKAVDFEPRPASEMSSYAAALFFNSSDSNELYVKKQDGTLIKMTAGASINASIIGGIGGDYASAGALVDYVDASDTYRMRQQTGASVRQFARVQSSDLDLYEYFAHPATPVPTNRVRLKSPTALAGSYDLTMPAALPGSTQILSVSSIGVVTASNTITNPLTMAANQDITVSGTGAYKHGDKILPCPPIPGYARSGAIAENTNLIVLSTAAADVWAWPIKGLIIGDRIRSIQIRFVRNTGTPVLALVKRTGSVSTIASQAVAAGGLQTVTIAAIDYTLVANEALYIQLTSAANLEEIHCADVTYDHP